MKKYFFLLLLLLPLGLSAGPLEKGFEALKVFNYFEAKGQFTKAMKNHPAGAAYGLSIIFYKNANPFHNIDSAYKYIQLSEKNFKAADAKEKETLLKLSINQSAIDGQREKIIISAFERAKAENTAESFNAFIKNFPRSSHEKEAKKFRSKLAFENAKKINTVQSYKDFIATYPDAEEIKDAKWLYDFSLFNSMTKPNKIENYEAFIKQYPKSQYKWQAEDSIYSYYTRSGRIIDYHFFVKNHGQNHNAKKAWENIYLLSTPEASPNEISLFTKNFPDFPDPSRIKKDLQRARQSFYQFSENGKSGFIDSLGNKIIPAEYEWAEDFSSGTAIVMQGEKAGYINKEGKLFIQCDYEEANAFSKGLAIAKKNKNFGLINKLGKVILPFQFDDISGNESSDNIIIGLKEGVYTYYDVSGKLLFEGKFEKAGDFSLERAYVVIGGKYGFINTKGATLIAAEYDWAENFKTNGLARVKKNEKFGMIDTSGKLLLPCEYSSIDEFSEGLALIVKDNKFGFVNESGSVTIPVKFDYSPEISASKGFKGGLAKIEQNKKRGLIDNAGKIVVPCIYDDIRNFSEDLCAVKKGKWGYLDKTKNQKIGFLFDYAWDFSGGLARVKSKGKIGFINKKGEQIIPPAYDEATDFKNSFSIVTLSGKRGVLDLSGKISIPCEIDEITQAGIGMLKLEKNGKLAYFNLSLSKQVWAEEGW